ncbi:unnamed protein product [Amoebophrya sp. A120]|nr:unnamed protein product [Amoebophrya sp. A120]|eukprot:GSA120T00020158001.1
MRRAQASRRVATDRVVESQLHNHLNEQVQQRKVQKLEEELKEAKSVHKVLLQQYDMGDLEAEVLASQKQRHISNLEQQLRDEQRLVVSKPTVVVPVPRLGPQESNPQGAPRAFSKKDDGPTAGPGDSEVVAKKNAVYDFALPGQEKENAAPPWLQQNNGQKPGRDLVSAEPPVTGAKKTRAERLAERQRERELQMEGNNGITVPRNLPSQAHPRAEPMEPPPHHQGGFVANAAPFVFAADTAADSGPSLDNTTEFDMIAPKRKMSREEVWRQKREKHLQQHNLGPDNGGSAARGVALEPPPRAPSPASQAQALRPPYREQPRAVGPYNENPPLAENYLDERTTNAQPQPRSPPPQKSELELLHEMGDRKYGKPKKPRAAAAQVERPYHQAHVVDQPRVAPVVFPGRDMISAQDAYDERMIGEVARPPVNQEYLRGRGSARGDRPSSSSRTTGAAANGRQEVEQIQHQQQQVDSARGGRRGGGGLLDLGATYEEKKMRIKREQQQEMRARMKEQQRRGVHPILNRRDERGLAESPTRTPRGEWSPVQKSASAASGGSPMLMNDDFFIDNINPGGGRGGGPSAPGALAAANGGNMNMFDQLGQAQREKQEKIRREQQREMRRRNSQSPLRKRSHSPDRGTPYPDGGPGDDGNNGGFFTRLGEGAKRRHEQALREQRRDFQDWMREERSRSRSPKDKNRNNRGRGRDIQEDNFFANMGAADADKAAAKERERRRREEYAKELEQQQQDAKQKKEREKRERKEPEWWERQGDSQSPSDLKKKRQRDQNDYYGELQKQIEEKQKRRAAEEMENRQPEWWEQGGGGGRSVSERREEDRATRTERRGRRRPGEDDEPSVGRVEQAGGGANTRIAPALVFGDGGNNGLNSSPTAGDEQRRAAPGRRADMFDGDQDSASFGLNNAASVGAEGDRKMDRAAMLEARRQKRGSGVGFVGGGNNRSIDLNATNPYAGGAQVHGSSAEAEDFDDALGRTRVNNGSLSQDEDIGSSSAVAAGTGMFGAGGPPGVSRAIPPGTQASGTIHEHHYRGPDPRFTNINVNQTTPREGVPQHPQDKPFIEKMFTEQQKCANDLLTEQTRLFTQQMTKEVERLRDEKEDALKDLFEMKDKLLYQKERELRLMENQLRLQRGEPPLPVDTVVPPLELVAGRPGIQDIPVEELPRRLGSRSPDRPRIYSSHLTEHLSPTSKQRQAELTRTGDHESQHLDGTGPGPASTRVAAQTPDFSVAPLDESRVQNDLSNVDPQLSGSFGPSSLELAQVRYPPGRGPNTSTATNVGGGSQQFITPRPDGGPQMISSARVPHSRMDESVKSHLEKSMRADSKFVRPDQTLSASLLIGPDRSLAQEVVDGVGKFVLESVLRGSHDSSASTSSALVGQQEINAALRQNTFVDTNGRIVEANRLKVAPDKQSFVAFRTGHRVTPRTLARDGGDIEDLNGECVTIRAAVASLVDLDNEPVDPRTLQQTALGDFIRAEDGTHISAVALAQAGGEVLDTEGRHVSIRGRAAAVQPRVHPQRSGTIEPLRQHSVLESVLQEEEKSLLSEGFGAEPEQFIDINDNVVAAKNLQRVKTAGTLGLTPEASFSSTGAVAAPKSNWSFVATDGALVSGKELAKWGGEVLDLHSRPRKLKGLRETSLADDEGRAVPTAVLQRSGTNFLTPTGAKISPREITDAGGVVVDVKGQALHVRPVAVSLDERSQSRTATEHQQPSGPASGGGSAIGSLALPKETYFVDDTSGQPISDATLLKADARIPTYVAADGSAVNVADLVEYGGLVRSLARDRLVPVRGNRSSQWQTTDGLRISDRGLRRIGTSFVAIDGSPVSPADLLRYGGEVARVDGDVVSIVPAAVVPTSAGFDHASAATDTDRGVDPARQREVENLQRIGTDFISATTYERVPASVVARFGGQALRTKSGETVQVETLIATQPKFFHTIDERRGISFADLSRAPNGVDFVAPDGSVCSAEQLALHGGSVLDIRGNSISVRPLDAERAPPRLLRTVDGGTLKPEDLKRFGAEFVAVGSGARVPAADLFKFGGEVLSAGGDAIKVIPAEEANAVGGNRRVETFARRGANFVAADGRTQVAPADLARFGGAVLDTEGRVVKIRGTDAPAFDREGADEDDLQRVGCDFVAADKSLVAPATLAMFGGEVLDERGRRVSVAEKDGANQLGQLSEARTGRPYEALNLQRSGAGFIAVDGSYVAPDRLLRFGGEVLDQGGRKVLVKSQLGGGPLQISTAGGADAHLSDIKVENLKRLGADFVTAEDTAEPDGTGSKYRRVKAEDLMRYGGKVFVDATKLSDQALAASTPAELQVTIPPPHLSTFRDADTQKEVKLDQLQRFGADFVAGDGVTRVPAKDLLAYGGEVRLVKPDGQSAKTVRVDPVMISGGAMTKQHRDGSSTATTPPGGAQYLEVVDRSQSARTQAGTISTPTASRARPLTAKHSATDFVRKGANFVAGDGVTEIHPRDLYRYGGEVLMVKDKTIVDHRSSQQEAVPVTVLPVEGTTATSVSSLSTRLLDTSTRDPVSITALRRKGVSFVAADGRSAVSPKDLETYGGEVLDLSGARVLLQPAHHFSNPAGGAPAKANSNFVFDILDDEEKKTLPGQERTEAGVRYLPAKLKKIEATRLQRNGTDFVAVDGSQVPAKKLIVFGGEVLDIDGRAVSVAPMSAANASSIGVDVKSSVLPEVFQEAKTTTTATVKATSSTGAAREVQSRVPVGQLQRLGADFVDLDGATPVDAALIAEYGGTVLSKQGEAVTLLPSGADGKASVAFLPTTTVKATRVLTAASLDASTKNPAVLFETVPVAELKRSGASFVAADGTVVSPGALFRFGGEVVDLHGRRRTVQPFPDFAKPLTFAENLRTATPLPEDQGLIRNGEGAILRLVPASQLQRLGADFVGVDGTRISPIAMSHTGGKVLDVDGHVVDIRPAFVGANVGKIAAEHQFASPTSATASTDRGAAVPQLLMKRGDDFVSADNPGKAISPAELATSGGRILDVSGATVTVSPSVSAAAGGAVGAFFPANDRSKGQAITASSVDGTEIPASVLQTKSSTSKQTGVTSEIDQHPKIVSRGTRRTHSLPLSKSTGFIFEDVTGTPVPLARLKKTGTFDDLILSPTGRPVSPERLEQLGGEVLDLQGAVVSLQPSVSEDFFDKSYQRVSARILQRDPATNHFLDAFSPTTTIPEHVLRRSGGTVLDLNGNPVAVLPAENEEVFVLTDGGKIPKTNLQRRNVDGAEVFLVPESRSSPARPVSAADLAEAGGEVLDRNNRVVAVKRAARYDGEFVSADGETLVYPEQLQVVGRVPGVFLAGEDPSAGKERSAQKTVQLRELASAGGTGIDRTTGRRLAIANILREEGVKSLIDVKTQKYVPTKALLRDGKAFVDIDGKPLSATELVRNSKKGGQQLRDVSGRIVTVKPVVDEKNRKPFTSSNWDSTAVFSSALADEPPIAVSKLQKQTIGTHSFFVRPPNFGAATDTPAGIHEPNLVSPEKLIREGGPVLDKQGKIRLLAKQMDYMFQAEVEEKAARNSQQASSASRSRIFGDVSFPPLSSSFPTAHPENQTPQIRTHDRSARVKALESSLAGDSRFVVAEDPRLLSFRNYPAADEQATPAMPSRMRDAQQLFPVAEEPGVAGAASMFSDQSGAGPQTPIQQLHRNMMIPPSSSGLTIDPDSVAQRRPPYDSFAKNGTEFEPIPEQLYVRDARGNYSRVPKVTFRRERRGTGAEWQYTEDPRGAYVKSGDRYVKMPEMLYYKAATSSTSADPAAPTTTTFVPVPETTYRRRVKNKASSSVTWDPASTTSFSPVVVQEVVYEKNPDHRSSLSIERLDFSGNNGHASGSATSSRSPSKSISAEPRIFYRDERGNAYVPVPEELYYKNSAREYVPIPPERFSLHPDGAYRRDQRGRFVKKPDTEQRVTSGSIRQSSEMRTHELFEELFLPPASTALPSSPLSRQNTLEQTPLFYKVRSRAGAGSARGPAATSHLTEYFEVLPPNLFLQNDDGNFTPWVGIPPTIGLRPGRSSGALEVDDRPPMQGQRSRSHSRSGLLMQEENDRQGQIQPGNDNEDFSQILSDASAADPKELLQRGPFFAQTVTPPNSYVRNRDGTFSKIPDERFLLNEETNSYEQIPPASTDGDKAGNKGSKIYVPTRQPQPVFYKNRKTNTFLRIPEDTFSRTSAGAFLKNPPFSKSVAPVVMDGDDSSSVLEAGGDAGENTVVVEDRGSKPLFGATIRSETETNSEVDFDTQQKRMQRMLREKSSSLDEIVGRYSLPPEIAGTEKEILLETQDEKGEEAAPGTARASARRASRKRTLDRAATPQMLGGGTFDQIEPARTRGEDAEVYSQEDSASQSGETGGRKPQNFVASLHRLEDAVEALRSIREDHGTAAAGSRGTSAASRPGRGGTGAATHHVLNIAGGRGGISRGAASANDGLDDPFASFTRNYELAIDDVSEVADPSQDGSPLSQLLKETKRELSAVQSNNLSSRSRGHLSTRNAAAQPDVSPLSKFLETQADIRSSVTYPDRQRGIELSGGVSSMERYGSAGGGGGGGLTFLHGRGPFAKSGSSSSDDVLEAPRAALSSFQDAPPSVRDTVLPQLRQQVMQTQGLSEDIRSQLLDIFKPPVVSPSRPGSRHSTRGGRF